MEGKGSKSGRSHIARSQKGRGSGGGRGKRSEAVEIRTKRSPIASNFQVSREYHTFNRCQCLYGAMYLETLKRNI